MKHLKTYKIFESSDSDKEMVRDLLRDISDLDIPVEVELEIGPSWSDEENMIISIGKDMDWSLQTEKASDLPLYDNIDNLSEVNDYLVGEGYRLESIHLLSESPITNTESDNTIKRMISYEFDDFIKNIKDIQEGNEIVRNKNWKSAFFPKIIRLVNIYFNKKNN